MSGTETSRERNAVAIVCLALIGSIEGGVIAAVIARIAGADGLVPTMIGTLVGALGACALGRRGFARTLPSELDGWFARRRIARWWWALSVVLALVNTARLVWFVGAPEAVWASAFPPVPDSAKHQCLGAYVRAGELAKLGRADLWDTAEYVGPTPGGAATRNIAATNPRNGATNTGSTAPANAGSTAPAHTTGSNAAPTNAGSNAAPTNAGSNSAPTDAGSNTAPANAGSNVAPAGANAAVPTHAVTPTRVNGLEPYMADPYEYPPPFVVLPRVGLAVTNDYELLRIAWYGLSAVGFWLAFVAIAVWMRGRAGATALLLAPLIALSFPLTLGLQFGQAHVAVVAAAVAGSMLLARQRYASGGLLLAFAITTKIFPGLLLVYFAMRRQWRAVIATCASIAVLAGLAALVVGPATFGTFVTEHLPRMNSGEAFAFTETNPDNNSLYGLAFKLNMLGVDAGRGLASALSWAWTLIAIALTVLAARRVPHGSDGDDARGREVLAWLAIICMATLRSPFAPIYTSIGTLWLLAVALGVMHRRAWVTVLIGIAWFLLQGAPPLGSTAMNAAAALPAQLATIAIAVLAALPRRRA